MDVSSLRDWKPATLTRSKVMLQVVSASTFEGSNPDEAGNVTTGLKFFIKVVGPDGILLNNGESALGYEFNDTLFDPKPNANINYANRCIRAKLERIVACFGEDFPDTINDPDWVGKQFWATVKPVHDDYNDEDVPKILHAYPIGTEGMEA